MKHRLHSPVAAIYLEDTMSYLPENWPPPVPPPHEQVTTRVEGWKYQPPPPPRRGHTSWWWLAPVLVLIALVFIIGSGCTSSKPKGTGAAPPPTVASAPVDPTVPAVSNEPITTAPTPEGFPAHPLGESAHITDDDGLDELAIVYEVRPFTSDNQFIQPEKGAFLTAEVHQRVSAGSTPYNLLYWRLQGPDGTTYDATNAADPSYGAGDLSAGQQTRGLVTFDVPRATAHGLIILTDPLGSQVSSWRF